MIKVILILACLAMAAGAYFGWENKSDYEAVHEDVDAFQTELKELKKKNVAFLNRLDEAKATRDREVSAREEADIRQALAAGNIEKRTKAIADTRKELSAVQEQVLEITSILDGIDVPDINTLQTELEDFAQKKSELEVQLSELELLVAQARQGVRDAQEVIRSNAEAELARNAKFNVKQRRAQISAVDPEWGFVVINMANTSGIAPDDRAIVERNGQRVGLLVIRRVDARQVVADVVSRGGDRSRIQPGDSVVFDLTSSDRQS